VPAGLHFAIPRQRHLEVDREITAGRVLRNPRELVVARLRADGVSVQLKGAKRGHRAKVLRDAGRIAIAAIALGDPAETM
jgi:hypothetical protein